MTNVGKIIDIDGQQITVSVVRTGSCGENCTMCNGCENKKIQVKAFSDVDVKIGDTVVLNSDSRFVYLGMFAMFILPLVLPLFFYVIMYRFGNTVAIPVSLAALLISVLCVYALSKFKPYLKKITPRIIYVVNK